MGDGFESSSAGACAHRAHKADIGPQGPTSTHGSNHAFSKMVHVFLLKVKPGIDPPANLALTDPLVSGQKFAV